MQIPKPSDVDKAFFVAVVPDDPRVTIKPMFGNVAGFVNGSMFMGLFGSSLGLRLAPSDAERLLAIDGAGPFGPAERPMGGYVAVPDAWRDDRARLDEWIGRAFKRGIASTQGAEGGQDALTAPRCSMPSHLWAMPDGQCWRAERRRGDSGRPTRPSQ